MSAKTVKHLLSFMGIGVGRTKSHSGLISEQLVSMQLEWKRRRMPGLVTTYESPEKCLEMFEIFLLAP